MKRTTMFMLLTLVALAGCTSVKAQCPNGNCYSYGAYTPWVGFWYYQYPFNYGYQYAAKPAAKEEPAAEPEPIQKPDVQEDLAEIEKGLIEQGVIEPEEPEIVEAKPLCLRVIELVNERRAAAGLPPLAHDDGLCEGCAGHSAWMSRNGFQHAYGIGGRECIAYGVASPEAVVRLWLGSDGHRAILLGSGRSIGCGASGTFWTLRVR